LDESGRPDFHALQHFQATASRIRYYVFDLLIFKGRDLTSLPLSDRRKVLATVKLRSQWIRISEQFNISAADMLAAVIAAVLAFRYNTLKLNQGSVDS
jgi:bifunctional non-homologous end joining protein LigD